MKNALIFIPAFALALSIMSCKQATNSDGSGGGGGQVKTPSFSQTTGTYRSRADIVIYSGGTSGAVIHYTTDGTTPSAASATYSAAIPVYQTTTLKAIEVKQGMTDSAIATAVYTFDTGPLTSLALDRSVVDFAQPLPRIALGAGGTATRVRYEFTYDFSNGNAMPFVVVDDAPVFPTDDSLAANQFFPNGQWRLKSVEIDTPTLQHRYQIPQHGYNYTPVPTFEYQSRAPGSTSWVGAGTEVYGIAVPAFTVSNGGQADSTAPVVTAVTFAGTATGAGGRYQPGDAVTFTVSAADASSGIASLQLHLFPIDKLYQQNLPSQDTSAAFLDDVALTSPGTYQVQVVLGDNPYPFDLYPAVTIRDLRWNGAEYYCNVDQSTTNYSTAAVGGALQGGSTPAGTVPIWAIAYVSPAWEAAALAPGAADGTWHNFSLSPSGYDVYAYSVTQNQQYYFQTNDGQGGGGTNSATKVSYYLIYGDKTPRAYGPASGSNYNAAANALPITASMTGTLFVVSRMAGDGAGSTAAHHLTTAAPTTP